MNFTSPVKSVGGYLKGVGQAAFKGENAGNAAQAALSALKDQNKKHIMHLGIGAAGASGLAGLTYLKGRNDGLQKQASARIDEYLKSLPEDSKKKLLKKIKIKKTNLYAKSSEKGK